MMTFIIIIHVAICFGLIGLVLIQRGRGSGLVESFQGVESMFGTKTNAFLTRSTTILSIFFFITCLSLAVLSVRQSRSLLSNIKTRTQAPAIKVLPEKAPTAQATQAQPTQQPAQTTTQPQAPSSQQPAENAVKQQQQIPQEVPKTK